LKIHICYCVTEYNRISNELFLTQISSSPEILRQSLSFFFTAGFLIPAIILLLIGLFYYRSKAASHRVMTNSFKQQLAMEGQDKQYLLARLVSVRKQQQSVLN